MQTLSEQELHNLAMNIVGKALEEEGFEFLGVNSELKKDPQFVCLKEKKLHFVVVKAVTYPNDPKQYDQNRIQKVKAHALTFKAQTFYAGVGLAHAEDYERPLNKGDRYAVNYQGLIEVF